jgi:hypothetical protein
MNLRQILALTILTVSLQSFAQTEILIPYRSGALWGMADTNLNIVVKPQYDSVGYRYRDPKGYYTVKKNGKFGVITKDKVIIPPSLREVSYRYGFIADVVKPRNGQEYSNSVYYSRKGHKILEDTIRFMHPLKGMKGHQLYNVLGRAGKKSLFVYDKSDHRITNWVYKNKEYTHTYAAELNGEIAIYCEDYDLVDVFVLTTDSSGDLSFNQLDKSEVQAIR